MRNNKNTDSIIEKISHIFISIDNINLVFNLRDELTQEYRIIYK